MHVVWHLIDSLMSPWSKVRVMRLNECRFEAVRIYMGYDVRRWGLLPHGWRRISVQAKNWDCQAQGGQRRWAHQIWTSSSCLGRLLSWFLDVYPRYFHPFWTLFRAAHAKSNNVLYFQIQSASLLHKNEYCERLGRKWMLSSWCLTKIMIFIFQSFLMLVIRISDICFQIFLSIHCLSILPRVYTYWLLSIVFLAWNFCPKYDSMLIKL